MAKRDNKKDIKDRDKDLMKQISVFEKEQKKLSKLVGHKAGENVESQQISLQAVRAAIMMILSAIPKAERVFSRYKNERAAYALVSVTNLLRELLRDLAALSGFSQIGDRILDSAVEPALLNMAQTHIAGLKDLRQIVYEKVTERKVRRKLLKKIDETIEAQATYVNDARIQLSEQIDSLVQSGGMKK